MAHILRSKQDVINDIPDTALVDEYTFLEWKKKYYETVLTSDGLYWSPSTNTPENFQITYDEYDDVVHDIYNGIEQLRKSISSVIISASTKPSNPTYLNFWVAAKKSFIELEQILDNAIENTYDSYNQSKEFIEKNQEVIDWFFDLTYAEVLSL